NKLVQDNRDVSLGVADQYMREVRMRGRLSDEEKNRLIKRLARGNVERLKSCPNQWVLALARDARERLVEGYQPWIVTIAKHYLGAGHGMELLDFVQEGNIGLLQALDGFLPPPG